jgi:hypothetical protein
MRDRKPRIPGQFPTIPDAMAADAPRQWRMDALPVATAPVLTEPRSSKSANAFAAGAGCPFPLP